MLQIFTDPICNLSPETLDSLNIKVLPYITVCFDKPYLTTTAFSGYSEEALLQSLRQDKPAPGISRPPLGTWIDIISEAYSKGNDILYIGMSKKLTGSYQSINFIKSALAIPFPDRVFEVYDTTSCSWGQGYLVKYAAELLIQGICDISLIKNKLDSMRLKIENWYLPVNTKVWQETCRGTLTINLDFSEFCLLTCDSEGTFRPDRKFSIRKACIDSLIKPLRDTEIWVSFTKDLDEDKEYFLDSIDSSNQVKILSPAPGPTATFGPNTIELAIIRK